MKQFQTGNQGLLRLTEGISHIIGYEVGSVEYPSRRELLSSTEVVYTLTGQTHKIPTGARVSITEDNPHLNLKNVDTDHVKPGGFLVSVNISNMYYIQQSSLEAVVGLD